MLAPNDDTVTTTPMEWGSAEHLRDRRDWANTFAIRWCTDRKCLRHVETAKAVLLGALLAYDSEQRVDAAGDMDVDGEIDGFEYVDQMHDPSYMNDLLDGILSSVIPY